ncbi:MULTISPECIES: helix-turn-helix transcriptional regulator [unclassified Streptomyces]|uniref:helix-turn-helix transcriptional regulator n=1 Tax=unclassified Streptomyces TaxID=2593676 RepID=UPI00055F92EE|nr:MULTISPECIES: LuxR family transcriptional regulator [unclassified Streptomyces]KOV96531.1 LuxR family transcriptional regulator [Streptomyces sp. NRRL WC-3723]
MSAHTGSDDVGPDGTAGLLGRERERKLVAALLTALPRGEGRVLHLSGAPGTGKSAVIRFAAAAAGRQGIRVLSTAWAPGERGLRHAALHRLLRPALAGITALPDRERTLLDAAFGGGVTTPGTGEPDMPGTREPAAVGSAELAGPGTGELAAVGSAELAGPGTCELAAAGTDELAGSAFVEPAGSASDELAGSASALLSPSVCAEQAAVGSAEPVAPAPAQLAAAMMRLLAVASEPVLLCVDDLDRLDGASRDTLRALARLCAHTRVGLIVAERAASDVRTLPHAVTVTLGSLPSSLARALVTRAGRATGYAEEQLVLAVGRGNPLALTELSMDGGHPGDAAGFGMLPATPRLAEAYAEDVEGLSAPARTVLLTAALSASPVTRDILRASTSLLDGDRAARAGLTETIARGLVAESVEVEGAEGAVVAEGAGPVLGAVDLREEGAEENRRLYFPEPLVRPAVLRLESAARRMAAHHALGRSLTSPPHAAWHTAQCVAGPDEELARRLESLATAPLPGTAVLVALAALEHAARLSSDPERRAARLLRAAELACEHGLTDQAFRYARQIDPTELGTFGRALLLWVHDLLPGSSAVGRERIAELCEAARAVAPQDPALTQKLLYAAARRCWWQQAGLGERRMVLRTFEDLRSGPRDARDVAVMALTDPLSLPCTEPPHSAAAHSVYGLPDVAGSRSGSGLPGVAGWRSASGLSGEAAVHSVSGLPGVAAPHSAPGLPDAATPQPAPGPAGGHGDGDGDEQSLVGQVAHLVSDLDRAAPLLEAAEAAVRAGGRYGRLPQLLVPRAMGQIWLGTQWHIAQALAEEGRMIAGRTGQPDWVARATGTLGIIAALRGQHDRALEYAAEVEEASLRLGQNRQLNLAVLTRALTASGTGRYAEAYARLRSLFAGPATPYAFEQFWGLAFLAEAALPAGEEADARTVVEQVTALTEAGRAPLPQRILVYAAAVLGPDDEAEVRYRRALRPGVGAWPLLHGMTQFGYGAWLRRRRRVTESRTPLGTAESVLRTLGASSRAEQAASELRATGQAADEQSRTDDIARLLSPQQLTIARLAARGLTNRAIGEQLRLSPRTVASHLYQIFPKLGVSSRVQLAARIGSD